MTLVVRPAVVRLELPWPPSNNRFYRRFGTRTIMSLDGRNYHETVWGVVLAAGRPKMPAKVRLSVTIDAHPPDRQRRDLDNLPKGILDSVVKAGVIADDSLIDRLTITRRAVVPGGRVVLTITPYDPREDS